MDVKRNNATVALAAVAVPGEIRQGVLVTFM
jgi:hypothetical protein